MDAALRRTPSLLDRLFTAAEQQACGGAAARLAGRFAAKEAVAKALGTGIRFPWTDIEITNDAAGRPLVTLHGQGAQTALKAAIVRVHVSISTAQELVVAHAVAEADSR